MLVDAGPRFAAVLGRSQQAAWPQRHLRSDAHWTSLRGHCLTPCTSGGVNVSKLIHGCHCHPSCGLRVPHLGLTTIWIRPEPFLTCSQGHLEKTFARAPLVLCFLLMRKCETSLTYWPIKTLNAKCIKDCLFYVCGDIIASVFSFEFDLPFDLLLKVR